MNLQRTLALFAFPLLISRAIQVSIGTPAARACCLLIVQAELIEKNSSAFHCSKETCVCSFGWQGDFLELAVLSFGREPTKGKDVKS